MDLAKRSANLMRARAEAWQRFMTGDRAMRIAVAAGEQVAKNAELAAVQRKAWSRFIRVVLAGGPVVHPSEATSASEQFHASQSEFGAAVSKSVRA